MLKPNPSPLSPPPAKLSMKAVPSEEKSPSSIFMEVGCWSRGRLPPTPPPLLLWLTKGEEEESGLRAAAEVPELTEPNGCCCCCCCCWKVELRLLASSKRSSEGLRFEVMGIGRPEIPGGKK